MLGRFGEVYTEINVDVASPTIQVKHLVRFNLNVGENLTIAIIYTYIQGGPNKSL